MNKKIALECWVHDLPDGKSSLDVFHVTGDSIPMELLKVLLDGDFDDNNPGLDLPMECSLLVLANFSYIDGHDNNMPSGWLMQIESFMELPDPNYVKVAGLEGELRVSLHYNPSDGDR